LFAAGGFISMSFTSAPMMLTNAAFTQEGNDTTAAPNTSGITTTTTADNLLYEETGNTMGNEIIAITNNSAEMTVPCFTLE
jgi:hypothetical protein